ncbi:unnamed protein product [Notodromas monacha]|uniref:Uncharacterized protein n=1 Tax=Notodromas monacha TaxID=399045 RepID=A0A7R9BIJ3_9CRUS|nr:unnamed protein product [Notodromas monacha]CAG0915865.1 unnamed protein product [Notodromas monacha]
MAGLDEGLMDVATGSSSSDLLGDVPDEDVNLLLGELYISERQEQPELEERTIKFPSLASELVKTLETADLRTWKRLVELCSVVKNDHCEARIGGVTLNIGGFESLKKIWCGHLTIPTPADLSVSEKGAEISEGSSNDHLELTDAVFKELKSNQVKVPLPVPGTLVADFDFSTAKLDFTTESRKNSKRRAVLIIATSLCSSFHLRGKDFTFRTRIRADQRTERAVPNFSHLVEDLDVDIYQWSMSGWSVVCGDGSMSSTNLRNRVYADLKLDESFIFDGVSLQHLYAVLFICVERILLFVPGFVLINGLSWSMSGWSVVCGDGSMSSTNLRNRIYSDLKLDESFLVPSPRFLADECFLMDILCHRVYDFDQRVDLGPSEEVERIPCTPAVVDEMAGTSRNEVGAIVGLGDEEILQFNLGLDLNEGDRPFRHWSSIFEVSRFMPDNSPTYFNNVGKSMKLTDAVFKELKSNQVKVPLPVPGTLVADFDFSTAKLDFTTESRKNSKRRAVLIIATSLCSSFHLRGKDFTFRTRIRADQRTERAVPNFSHLVEDLDVDIYQWSMSGWSVVCGDGSMSSTNLRNRKEFEERNV